MSAQWTSATAPTAAGKTFLVLNWLLSQVESRDVRLGVFLAPTRALVSEIERQLLEAQREFNIVGLRISSLPISALGDRSAPTILVLTQERLQLFLNAMEKPPTIDVTIVDEAHKLGDGVRGVLLQDAIERVLRGSERCKFVFLSPHTENPEVLLDDAPQGAQVAVIPGSAPTVTQHLIAAKQRRRKPREWMLSLIVEDDEHLFGEFTLKNSPDGQLKRIALVALELGRKNQGTLVYANGAANTEKIAHVIYDGLSEETENVEVVEDELIELSEFCRHSIHEKFLLVDLVKRGVAFHYGNMPTLLRNEIERLFRNGKIRFLVCTSTLIEGVNLACRTIVVCAPKKGKGTLMSPPDFWNLAGRAGRWGADFHGNIVCVDPDKERLWPQGVPRRSAYSVIRETDRVISQTSDFQSYIQTRNERTTRSVIADIESVASYVIAYYIRTGTSAGSPSVRRMTSESIIALDESIGEVTSEVEIPESITSAHPTINALALQRLLDDFRAFVGDPDDLLPTAPESDDAVTVLTGILFRINENLAFEFGEAGFQLACAIISVDWMRGKRIAEIINNMVRVRRRQNTNAGGNDINYANVIRETFQRIEEIARFKVPKYLAAYVDVLRFHFQQIGRGNDFPRDLKLDLFLEFGVGTTTLLSLIGIGLSRSSAIELSEFLERSELSEEEVLIELRNNEWEKLDLTPIVRREISEIVARRTSPDD